MTIKSSLSPSKWAPKDADTTKSTYFDDDILKWSKQISALERTTVSRIEGFFKWATKKKLLRTAKNEADGSTNRDIRLETSHLPYTILISNFGRLYTISAFDHAADENMGVGASIISGYSARELEIDVAGKDTDKKQNIREIHKLLKESPETIRQLKAHQVCGLREYQVTMANLILDEARKVCKSKNKEKAGPVQLEFQLDV